MSASPFQAFIREVCHPYFTENVIRRGMQYHQFNRVVSSSGVVEGEQVRVHAIVRGSAPKPYRVKVVVSRTHDDGISVLATCNCAGRDFCKHAVAAIADVLKQGDGFLPSRELSA